MMRGSYHYQRETKKERKKMEEQSIRRMSRERKIGVARLKGQNVLRQRTRPGEEKVERLLTIGEWNEKNMDSILQPKRKCSRPSGFEIASVI